MAAIRVCRTGAVILALVGAAVFCTPSPEAIAQTACASVANVVAVGGSPAIRMLRSCPTIYATLATIGIDSSPAQTRVLVMLQKLPPRTTSELKALLLVAERASLRNAGFRTTAYNLLSHASKSLLAAAALDSYALVGVYKNEPDEKAALALLQFASGLSGFSASEELTVLGPSVEQHLEALSRARRFDLLSSYGHQIVSMHFDSVAGLPIAEVLPNIIAQTLEARSSSAPAARDALVTAFATVAPDQALAFALSGTVMNDTVPIGTQARVLVTTLHALSDPNAGDWAALSAALVPPAKAKSTVIRLDGDGQVLGAIARLATISSDPRAGLVLRVRMAARYALATSSGRPDEAALAQVALAVSGAYKPLKTYTLSQLHAVVVALRPLTVGTTKAYAPGDALFFGAAVQNFGYTEDTYWVRYVPLLVSIPALLVLIGMTFFLVFWQRPLWLLRAREPVDQLVAACSGSAIAQAPLKFIAALMTLWLHPHVQDAWLRRHLRRARNHAIPRLAGASGYISLPVTIKPLRSSEQIYERRALDAQSIRALVNKRTSVDILITGESGIGKTTTAGWLASLALEPSHDSRLWRHLAYPFIVGRDFDGAGITSADQFLHLIARDMGSFSSSDPLPLELVKAMLEDGRIVVIADGVSEMPASGFAALLILLNNATVNSFIATSRADTAFPQHDPVLIKPRRIAGKTLTSFALQYAEAKNLAFDADDILRFCDQLRKFAGTDTTPLMVTMYLDMREAERDGVPLSSIPQFMKMYLRRINDQVTENRRDYEDVIARAKAVAKACCVSARTYCSAVRRIDDLTPDVPDQTATLEYLEGRLRVIERIEPGRSMVRFSIDTLCEYLAALYVAGSTVDQLPRLQDGASDELREAYRAFLLKVLECLEDEAKGSNELIDPAVREAVIVLLSDLPRPHEAAV
jgi:hypothetical protein